MVAGGENLEAVTLGENAPDEFENVLEDDDEDPADDEVSGDEDGDEEGGGESEDEDEDDDDDEEEEDPDDPQDILREKCGEMSRCMALKSEFDTCESRVNSRQKTEENCAQELLDFVGCVDKCEQIRLVENGLKTYYQNHVSCLSLEKYVMILH